VTECAELSFADTHTDKMTSPKGRLVRHTFASANGRPTLFQSLQITSLEITRLREGLFKL